MVAGERREDREEEADARELPLRGQCRKVEEAHGVDDSLDNKAARVERELAVHEADARVDREAEERDGELSPHGQPARDLSLPTPTRQAGALRLVR